MISLQSVHYLLIARVAEYCDHQLWPSLAMMIGYITIVDRE